MPLTIFRRKNRGPYYIRGTVTIWRDGQPERLAVYQSTRTTDYSAADGARRQLEARIAEISITGREPALSFGEALISYLDAGGSARFLEKPLDALEHVSIDKIDQVMLERLGRKAYPFGTPATMRRQWFTPIIAVLRHAGVERRFHRPRVSGGRRTVFVLPADADRIIAAAAGGKRPHPWAPAILTFLFGQGTRTGEALALDMADLHLEHRFAILRDTKNGDERAISLTDRTIAALSRLPNLGQPGPVFRNQYGRPYRPSDDNRGGQIRELFARCVRAAGLDPALVTPHVARHSWATWFYSQTLDTVRLRDEGGWRSGEWQRYVQISRPSIGDEARNRGWHFTDEKAAPEGAAIRT